MNQEGRSPEPLLERSGPGGLLGWGQAHAVLPPVEDAVVLPEEDVPQDPQRPFGRHHVGSLEAAEAELLLPQHLLRTHASVSGRLG